MMRAVPRFLLPGSVFALAVMALSVMSGCEPDVPAPAPPALPPPAQPDVELPAPEQTGPLGPIATQTLPFTPPLDQPGLPAMMLGGSLLLTDPRQAPFVQETLTHRLQHIDTRPANWTRLNRYAAGIELVPFTSQTVPEIVVAAGTNRAAREFSVMFRQGTAWVGPYDARRAMFELPREGLPRWEHVTALGVFGPRDNQMLIGTTDGIFVATVTPSGEETSSYEKSSEERVVSIAGLPGGVAYAVRADGAVLKIARTRVDDVTTWNTREVVAAKPDAAPAVSIQTMADPADPDGQPLLAVRHTDGVRIGPWFYMGRVALLRDGLLVRLSDEGELTVFRVGVENAPVLASITGMPANADWLGADPSGETVVAIKGDTLAICAVKLDDPAYVGK